MYTSIRCNCRLVYSLGLHANRYSLTIQLSLSPFITLHFQLILSATRLYLAQPRCASRFTAPSVGHSRFHQSGFCASTFTTLSAMSDITGGSGGSLGKHPPPIIKTKIPTAIALFMMFPLCRCTIFYPDIKINCVQSVAIMEGFEGVKGCGASPRNKGTMVCDGLE